MQAIIHIGAHKTGSTYVQHILNDRHEALLAAGSYYEHQPGYPAHHPAAWSLLRGDAGPVRRMAAAAREAGAARLIVSSEDLDALIYRTDLALGLCAALQQEGVQSIRFVAVLRRPSELFWSLYSELASHEFTDVLQMYYAALKLGYVYVERPIYSIPTTPFWKFCFDLARDLPQFAAQLRAAGCHLTTYDFAACARFPGDALLESLGVDTAQLGGPEDLHLRNARLPEAERDLRMLQRFQDAHPTPAPAELSAFAQQHMQITPQVVEAITATLSARYDAGYQAGFAGVASRDWA